MYENLDKKQINYCAPEIVEHPSHHPRGDEHQFNDFAHFLLELQILSSARVKLALVLIFHPDKSMTLLINEHCKCI